MRLAVLAAALLVAAPVSAAPKPPRPHALVYQMVGWPGRLGAQIADMTEDLRKYFGAPADAGVLVTHVEADQPAAKAGLRTGDVITDAAGQKIEDPSDIFEALGDKDAGTPVKLTIVRDKKTMTLTATLDKKRELPFDFKMSKLSKMDFPHEAFAWSGSSGEVEKLRKQLEALEKRLEQLEKKR